MRASLFAAALLVTMIAADGAPAQFPLGRWYTEGAENDVQVQILLEDHADGTFQKTGAFTDDCDSLKPVVESGTWTLTGSLYTEVTQNVGGETVDEAETDTFDYKRVDADHVTLHDHKTGVTWTLTRVGRDFTLPVPAHCAK